LRARKKQASRGFFPGQNNRGVSSAQGEEKKEVACREKKENLNTTREKERKDEGRATPLAQRTILFERDTENLSGWTKRQ